MNQAEKLIEKLINLGIDIGTKLLISIIILIIGTKIINALVNSLRKEHKWGKMESSVKSFLISFINIGLKIILFVTILGILGVPMTSIIAIIGSAGVAIGLALQGGLSNLAGGIMILIFKPFKVGDFIEANGKSGTVKSITLFYTTINSLENIVIQMPNGSLSNSVIVNYSAMKKRMVNETISVSYDSDIEKVKKVITKTINDLDNVLKEEPILVRLKAHNASSIDFVVRFWVDNKIYWDTYFDFMEKVKIALNKNKIEIPYPQMDVHIKK